ncbi:MAG TPA: hypothetical protein VFR02_08785 [bacterium]|nr:hypothetical protein [bacterium]
MYYGDSGKMIWIVFLTIILVLAGFYWHQSWFAVRFLAQLVFLNLPPHLQEWLSGFFGHSPDPGTP